jgi:rhamnopyranosyl-N-acetylglucosaminyl-diphospho-decaprenol beta-1,3/1,4-galactofuranosyltransferase
VQQPVVACAVVTRDRRELLRECLSAIAAQSAPIATVVVVDNASSDGTPDMVRAEFPSVELVALAENVGGAGGFHAAIARAHATGAEWVWVMDDDTIARPDALERLLAASWREAGLREPALLSSRVDWSDGHPHPMNTPILRRRDAESLVRAAGAGLLPLRSATFVSLLVSAGAIDRHGLPRREFFLQADDVEFTARILRSEAGYLVPDSVVEHRTRTAHTFTDDPFRFYHHLRNTLYMLRGDAWDAAEKPALAWVVLDSSARFMSRSGWSADSARTVARALRDGLRGLA